MPPRILAAKQSKVAHENMDAFRDAWENQVRILTEAVDDITTIDDFLAVSEAHILEDVSKCLLALQEGQAEQLDRTAGAIRGRSARVCNVVVAEMDNYESGAIHWSCSTCRFRTSRPVDSRTLLAWSKKFSMVSKTQITLLITSMILEQLQLPFLMAFVTSRRCVLMNRTVDELDSDAEIEIEENIYETRASSKASEVDEFPGVAGVSNARDVYRLMPEEEKEKIVAAVETFRTEKNKFDREVAKWDDRGNDIIVLGQVNVYDHDGNDRLHSWQGAAQNHNGCN